MINNTKSKELFSKANELFPGGVNSPVRAFKSVGGTPVFIKKGKGSRIWDADGNEYIDFCCSWGPLILGHANDGVIKKIAETIQDGTSFGAPTELENKLAELIISKHDYLEKIRFVSSGTEAVMSAIRLARGVTGKDKIIKFDGCYHGHVDSLLVNAGSGLATFGTSSSAGVPESFANETIVLPLNDIMAVKETLKKFAHQIAAIIIEPVPANNGLLLQSKEFLFCLQCLCKTYGVLLIFDEVISGFRIGFSGASGHYGIKPDIITFGKIIGGGLPVGAYGGSAAIMSNIAPEGNVYQAGTLSGNPVAMAAGLEQLGQCLQPGFYDKINDMCSYFAASLNSFSKAKEYPFKVITMGSIFWMTFSKDDSINAASQIDSSSMEYFKKLYHFLLEQGVYFGPSGYEVGFVSAAHSKHDIDEAVEKIKKGLDFVFKK
jgi:glutamate-1-semialdehyde 2,1-aminomutase